MRSFLLSENEMNEMCKKQATPFLVLSTDKAAENYAFLRRHLPRVGIYYAIKANPHPSVLKRLTSMGSHFDVASAGEMEMLHKAGIDGSRMIYANPVHDERGLVSAARLGIKRFTFDDASEIGKIAKYVPNADVLVRVQVHNSKALVDLNTKFGVPLAEALPLLKQAEARGLHAKGICFHVGSQSLSTAAYEEALLLVHHLFTEAEASGLHLTDLDIGGGFPIPSAKGLYIDLAAMLEAINRQIDRLFPKTQVWCEPGRFICGTAMNLVTSVIGTKMRGDKPWYILDEGIYGVFSGILFDHWEYPLHCFGSGKKIPSTFAGPSCDGIDVLYRDFLAPKLKIGDKVLAGDIGAYTTVSATHFNGFMPAPVLIWEEQEDLACKRQQNLSEDETEPDDEEKQRFLLP